MGDDEILDEFKEESKELIEQMMNCLEEIEGDFSQVDRLAEFGGLVDRIMGGAKNIALMYDEGHAVHKVAAYSEICKIVGYKASQIENNAQFYDITVALLLDATEMLESMVRVLGTPKEKKLREILTQRFLERLHWVNERFGDNVRASVDFTESKKEEDQPIDQNAIDDLLKSLGV